MQILNRLKQHYREAKAELQGLAISRASRVRTLREIDTKHKFFEEDERTKEGVLVSIGRCLIGNARPMPTGFKIRMRTGHPMEYYSDGSLRHAAGRSIARCKAARQAMRQVKRRRWANRMATA